MRRFVMWLFDLQEADRLARELRDCEARERYWRCTAQAALFQMERQVEIVVRNRHPSAQPQPVWIVDALAEIHSLPEAER
jgi:hypothetical protein